MEENKVMSDKEKSISKAELDSIKKEYDALQEELAELSDEELQEVAGGGGHRVPYRGQNKIRSRHDESQ